MKKRFFVCLGIEDEIPTTKIFEISEDTNIEDCDYPENTMMVMIIITEKEMAKLYESFLGMNTGTPGTMVLLTEDMEIEENMVYLINPYTGDLMPQELK